MKVLIISTEFPPGPGGIATNAYYMSYWLEKSGWQVCVLTPQDYVSDFEVNKFNNSQTFRIKRLRHLPFSFVEGVYRFFVLLKETICFHPSIIIASDTNSVILGCAIKRIFSLPLIAIAHADEFLKGGRLIRYLYQQANTIIAVSKWTMSLVVRKGIAAKKIRVITNGGDKNIFKPGLDSAFLEKRYGLSDKKVILTVGNVTLRKGQDLVIKAMPEILKHYPNAVYLIVGLPTEKERFFNLAKAWGVDKNIIFTGMAARQDLPYYYNLCDVFILPSRIHLNKSAEGYGIVVAEAALCRRTSIVTKGAGSEESVLKDKTGIIVDSNSPQAIARAVIKLFSEEDSAGELSANAQALALKENTWQNRISKYEKVIREALN